MVSEEFPDTDQKRGLFVPGSLPTNLEEEGDCIPEFQSWLKQVARKIKFYRFLSQYLTKKTWSSFKQRKPALSHWYTTHSPAIHLKRKWDNWDYAFNFSSELLASGLVLLVAVCTFAAFGFSGSKEHDFSDNSLASRFLAYHNNLNTQLYSKVNSIKTTVIQKGGFIETALANNSPLSATDVSEVSTDTEDEDFEKNIISAPSPDTVRDLLSKQVNIYETQEGDTLGSIARKFNLSIETIKSANRLPNNTIKKGWYLKILEQDGVLYKIAANDTGPDIAKYFGVDIQKIIDYNGLEGPLDFEAGQEIMIPGGKVPLPVAPPAAPKAKKVQPTPSGAIPRNGLYSKGHTFVSGQCTDYVARVFALRGDPIPWGGNANQWDTTAAPYAKVNKTPTVGSIIQFEASKLHSRYGHVGIVESISGNTVTYSEWNGPGGPFKKTFSTATISSAKFIHFKE